MLLILLWTISIFIFKKLDLISVITGSSGETRDFSLMMYTRLCKVTLQLLPSLSFSLLLPLFRKEQLDLSVAQCWSVLLTQTRQESRDHSSLSELCCNTLTQRLSHCIEDTHRLAKRVQKSLSDLTSKSPSFSSPLIYRNNTPTQNTAKPSSLFHTDSYSLFQGKEVGLQMQDELLKVTTEMQTVGWRLFYCELAKFTLRNTL